MTESDEESVSETEEEYSSEESSGSDEYSSSSVSGESDASDSLKERRDSHGRASVSSKQLKTMITNKAVLQEGEIVDSRVPSKSPRKPMVELTAGSNVWYQGQVIKESANEIKIVYTVPNAQGRPKPRVEWLRKASARIWRGSYKSHDWRHLGKGAWEPRAAPAKGARSKRSGGGGGSGKARKQKQKHRARKNSPDTASDEDDGDGGESSGEPPKSRSHHKGGSQRRRQDSHDGDLGARAGGGAGRTAGGGGGGSTGGNKSRAPAADADADAAGGAKLRSAHGDGGKHGRSAPKHASAAAAAAVEPLLQQQPADVGEQASEHSPDDVAESPGGFLCDQFSTRCSPSEEDGAEGRAAGAAGQPPDPTYDPLARWFLAHYSQLQAAGTLALLPGGMYECGRLPLGFSIDPSTALIVPDCNGSGCDGANAAQLLAAAAAGFSHPHQQLGANGCGSHNPAAHAPVGRSAAASPAPCAERGGASGSSTPAEQAPPQQGRRSGDGSGAAGAARSGGMQAPQRPINKQTSGGSSNGLRDRERERERDGASASPAAVGAGSKRQAAAEGPGGHDAGGGAGTGHALKKLKRAVIIPDSEDEDGDPPSQQPPTSAAETSAPPAAGGQARSAVPAVGPSGRSNAHSGAGVTAPGVKQEQAPSRPSGGGGPSNRTAAGAGNGEGGAAGSAGPGVSPAVGSSAARGGGGGGGGGGGAGQNAGGAGSAGGAAAGAEGTVGGTGAGGRGPATAGGNAGGPVSAANRGGGGSGAPGVRGGLGAAAGSGSGLAPAKEAVKKEPVSVARPRCITTMDHDL